MKEGKYNLMKLSKTAKAIIKRTTKKALMQFLAFPHFLFGASKFLLFHPLSNYFNNFLLNLIAEIKKLHLLMKFFMF